ncbi:hypothetical protein ACIPIU_01050 [Streptomyces massasporeus]|uniref:hypothetical protein n=1 Tax=Streptomyces massasporeus TaxID=67324 RepID=UPI00380A32DB
MDDVTCWSVPRGLEFVDDGAGQVLAATGLRDRAITWRPRALTSSTLADGPRRTEYLVWNRFNPGPATRAMIDVLGVGAPHGQASVGDY